MGNIMSKFFICIKDDEIVDNPFSWQNMLEEMLFTTKPNNRDIHWVYAKRGNDDILAFMNKIAQEDGVIHTSARGNQMKYSVHAYINALNMDPKIILLDATKFDLRYINYKGITDLKKGHFNPPSNILRNVIMDHPPHIAVFAYEKPKMKYFSEFNVQVVKLD